MAGAAYQKSSLRELLDRFVEAQRQDIHAYCGGHLNQSNLYRPIDQAPFAKWATAGPTKLNPLVVQSRKDEKHSDDDVENMKKSLCRFTLGAPGLHIPFKTLEETDYAEHCRGLDYDEEQINFSSKFSLHNVDSMIRQTSSISTPNSGAQRGTVTSAESTASQSVQCSAPLVHVQSAKVHQGTISHQNILMGHFETVTKKDKLRKMRTFDTQVLRRSDAFQQRTLSGVQAVDFLEKRLAKSLNDAKNDAPSFHRLQVYSDVFEELIETSPTFRYSLQKIKNAYENHLTSLLESQSEGHSTLQGDILRLSASHDDVAPKLERETERVQRLEQQARELLEENESLRRELAKELELASLPQLEMPTSVSAHPVELEPSELVGQLHSAIWEKMEAVRELRSKLKTECVPSSICTYLTQCLKDTDVETQKILSQKEYFERSIAELDRDLRDAVEAADTTERDAKRIWNGIQMIKSNLTTAADVAATADLLNSDEESAKWNWYIS